MTTTSLPGLNRYLFTETGTDSAALNVLGTLVHRFPDEGDYMIEVYRDDAFVGSRLLAVSHGYHTVQVTYDLATFGDDGCECVSACSCEDDFDCLREDGVAVFHVGTGPGGYSVRVDPVGERRERREFDSDELTEDDIFAALLLRPGAYTVRNERDGAGAEVAVRYPDGEHRATTRDAVEITVSDDGFEPSTIEIDPARGLSFIIETAARIVVELDEPHDRAGEDTETRPSIRRAPRLAIGSAVPFDPSEYTHADIESEVADITNPMELRALMLAERRGENRKTVVRTLRKRIRNASRLHR